jgi:hypothetical protein
MRPTRRNGSLNGGSAISSLIDIGNTMPVQPQTTRTS